jgi:hypothetical protein
MKKGENYMVELLKDKYGNHVVQKFIDLFDHENLLNLLQIINSHVFHFFTFKLFYENSSKQDLCSDQYGCLIIQKLVESHKQFSSAKHEDN